MPSKFTCEICLKPFKTTQHLNQHKNRKKKCQPCNKPEPIINLNLLNTIIETSSSSNDSTLGHSISTNISDITSSILTSNTNTNNNSIVSIQTLIELIVKYKTAVEEIKQLENICNSMKINIQKLHNENMLLKKQLNIVNKFIDEFTFLDLEEKDNKELFISPLTDIDSVVGPLQHLLNFPEKNNH